MKHFYQTHRNRVIFRSAVVFLLFAGVNFSVFGQTIGDYRSRQDGNWINNNTWQQFNGTTWVNSTPPANTVGNISITIRNAVTLNNNLVLNLNGTIIKMEGGTITGGNNNTRLNFNANSVCEMISSSAVPRPSGITTWNATSILRLINIGSTAISYTNITNQAFGIVEYNRPSQTDYQVFNFGGVATEFRFINSGGLAGWQDSQTIAGNVVFSGGYFDSSNYDKNLTFTINGDFTIQGGIYYCAFNNLSNISNLSTTRTRTIVNGNFVMTGGDFRYRATAQITTQPISGEGTIDVLGNVTISGGTFNNGFYNGETGFYINGAASKNVTITSSLPSDFSQRFYIKNDNTSINEIYNGTTAQLAVGALTPTRAGYLAWSNSGTIIKNFTVNNAAGVTLQTNRTINENLFLTNGTLTNSTNNIVLAANTTVQRTGGSVSNLLGGTGLYNVIYPTHTAQVTAGNEIPDSATRLQNVTINNTNGVKASKTFQVNGILNLGTANPTLTNGLLDMVISYGNYAKRVYGESGYFDSTNQYNNLNSYELRLGASATVTGQGDVTGKIRRNHTFVSGSPYSFGSANMRMTFTSVSGSALPSQMLITATKGNQGVHVDNQVYSGHPNQLTVARNTVQRLFQIQRTGGANNTQFTLRLPYSDAELQGNNEASLVTWDHHLPYLGKTPHEHGQTSRDASNNWVELANHGLGYLTLEGATTGDQSVTKYWMLSSRESISNFEFVGAVAPVNGSNWGINSNWVGGVTPTATDRGVIVRPATLNPNPLTINADVSAANFEIMSGGVVNVANGATITLTSGPIQNDGSASWNSQGTFNHGTGTVRFTGSNATVTSNANFHNLQIDNGAILTNSSGSTITIANNVTNNGTWNTTANENTVVYNGTTQNIVQNTYHNLELSGSGNHVLPSQTNLLGNLTINNSTVGFTSKIFNFNGVSDQTINGSNLPSVLDNIIVNKASGNLTIDHALSVNSLNLTNGTVFVNANKSLRLSNTLSRTNGKIAGTGTVIFEGPNSIISNLFDSNISNNNITLNKSTTNFSVPNNFEIRGNLALEQGTIAVNNNERLNLGGGVVKNQGFLNVKNATLGFVGSVAQNIGSGVFVDNEVKIIDKVDSGAVNFLGNTIVTELLSPNGGEINSNGNLKFRSTSSKTAFVGPVASGASVNGIVTVERYFPAKRAFRFLSSPVNTTSSIRDNWMEGVNNSVVVNNGNNTALNNLNPNPNFGTHITGTGGATNGFDASSTNNPSLFVYEQFLDGQTLTEDWLPINDVSSTTISAGKGYRLLIRGDRSIPLLNNAVPTPTTLRTSGTLATGTQNINNLSTLSNGYSLFGNPYQAPINMLQTLNTASANVDNTAFYVWDPLMNVRGAYVTVQLDYSSNSSDNSNLDSAANEFFQPGQAVFLKTTTDGPASISIQENHKNVTQGINQLFRQNAIQSNSSTSKLRVQLYDSNTLSLGGTSRDGLLLKFNASFNPAVVQGEDATKFSNADEDIAVKVDDQLLSIAAFPLPSNNDFIQLNNTKYRGTQYTYKIFYEGIPGIDAFLFDQYTQSLTPLLEGGNTFYDFQILPNVTAVNDPLRFKILFNSETLSNPDFSNQSVLFSLFPNPAKDVFYIKTNVQSVAKVKVVNMLGQLIYEREVQPINQKIEINAQSWQNGTYMISVSQDGNTQTQKLIKQP